MPRARRRCSRTGCRHFQPCPIKSHQRGWASSKSEPLPGDWKSRKRLVEKRAGGRCEWVEDGVRCSRKGTEVDHILNRARWPKGKPGLHDVNQLQLLCSICHKTKTQRESMEGR